ncbi:hypothetical protein ACE6H2_017718 [Prunus campanulata]
MRVNSSMAKDGQNEQPTTATNASENSQPAPSPLPPPSPKIVIPKFSDVLAFSGPAPERINGRIAIVGFVAALAVELSKGQDVFAQISDGGIPLFLGTSFCYLWPLLVPLLKGVSVESKSKGVMTSYVITFYKYKREEVHIYMYTTALPNILCFFCYFS